MKAILGRHVVSLAGLLVFVVLAVGSVDDSSSNRSQSSASSSVSGQKQWFQGGSLHNATIGEWKNAAHQNKLATASDWLAATKWKGHLNSPHDFDRIRIKSEMLVNAVDEVVTVEGIESMKVNEIAAAIVTMSNDLGP